MNKGVSKSDISIDVARSEEILAMHQIAESAPPPIAQSGISGNPPLTPGQNYGQPPAIHGQSPVAAFGQSHGNTSPYPLPPYHAPPPVTGTAGDSFVGSHTVQIHCVSAPGQSVHTAPTPVHPVTPGVPGPPLDAATHGSSSSHYPDPEDGDVTDFVERGDPYEEDVFTRCSQIVVITVIMICTLPFSLLPLLASIKVIMQYERAVVFRLGRALPGIKGPGLHFLTPCLDSMQTCDLRTVSYDIPPQEILTKDSVSVAVDAVVYYRVRDPFLALVSAANASVTTCMLAQTTLRKILGTCSLSEILSEREEISLQMMEAADEGTRAWGVQVERIEVKDVRLPFHLQRSMAAEAEASREAKAKIISAEGEQKASRALKKAADVINQSKGAVQLRYLQSLTHIASNNNQTIIFPLPLELLRKLQRGWKTADPKTQ